MTVVPPTVHVQAAAPSWRDPQETRMEDSARDRLIALAFWTLGALCLLNLNDLVRMWIGVERAFSVLMLLCCLVALAGLLRSPPKEALGVPGALILGCIGSHVGIGILVAILNGTEDQGSWYLMRYLGSALVIAAAAVGGGVAWRLVGGEKVMRRILVLLTASCALILASPWLLDFYRNPPRDGAYRYFGSFSDPNEAALVACFAVVAGLTFLRRGRPRILLYIALIVAIAAAVGTFSRTALIVLPLLFLDIVLVSRGSQRKNLAGGAAIIALVLAGVFFSLDPETFEERQLARWDSLLEISNPSAVDDVTLAGRSTLWSLAWDEAMESPLFGHGLGRLHQLDGAWYNDEGVLQGAHNQFLILLGEAGFVPLLLFTSFLAVTSHAGFRKERIGWALGAVSGWALVLILFSFTFQIVLTHRAANFIVGLSCAVMARSRWAKDARPEMTRAS